MNLELLDFLSDLQDQVVDYLPSDFLQIFTRHKRDSQIFHGHPNHRGKGPWKDWALVDWGHGWGVLPSQMHCFVDLEMLDTNKKIHFGGVVLERNVYAVVEVAEEDDDEEQLAMSDTFIPFKKEVGHINKDGQVSKRTFYLADTGAFVGPCCVIPDIGGPPNRHFRVRPREEWVKCFTKWINEPHDLDDMTDDDD